jgi:hypothetical protein
MANSCQSGQGEGSALLQGAGQAAGDLRGGIRAGSHSDRQRPTIGEHGVAHALGGPAVVFRGCQTLPLARPRPLPPLRSSFEHRIT